MAKKSPKMVTVTLPRDPNKNGPEADTEYFSVNFKSYLIKTDEPVTVPEEVAEVVNNAKKARMEGRKFANKVMVKEPK